MLTFCISTYNNLPYLELAIQSVRQYSYWKNAPFIIHAENCSDGTDIWLKENMHKYNLDVYSKISKYLKPNEKKWLASMFLHSDFYVTPNWDKELMKVHDKYNDEKLWVNSFRIEPNMFGDQDRPGTHFVPKEAFGAYHYDFKPEGLLEYAKLIAMKNDFEIPKGEGVSGLVKKSWWDKIGGNDPLFAPTSWDDYDLFLRMLNDGGRFVMPTKSIVWHFGARGSHRLEENNNQSSERQRKAEQANAQKFYNKWGGLPKKDEYGMICGIQ